MELPIKLSDEDLNYIIEGVAKRLSQAGKKPSRRRVEPKALCAYEAARYLGVSRPRFYELLQVDQALRAGAITIGTKRLWPTSFLDDWLAGKQGHHVVPRLTRRPPDGQAS